MFLKNKLFMTALFIFSIISVRAHDVLLEIKGAGFIATGNKFKNIYGRGQRVLAD